MSTVKSCYVNPIYQDVQEVLLRLNFSMKRIFSGSLAFNQASLSISP